MFKHYLRKVDLVIYFLCIVAAVTSLFAINYFDLSDSNEDLDLKKLGFVVDQRNVTKRKQVDSLAWRKVYSKSSLFTGDKVFTEESSLATLGVGKKSEIDLSELTLMKIDEQKNGSLNFDFIDGFFVAKVNDSDSIGQVKVGDALLVPKEKSNSKFQVNSTGDTSDISVMDGQLMLNNNGKRVELNKNQFAKVIKGSDEILVQTSKYRLLSPDLNQKIFLTSNEKISFRWLELDNEIQTGSKLLISKDKNFKLNVYSEFITTNFIDLDKKWESGEYFWKIVNKSNDLSFTQRFYVFLLGAPIVTQPLSDEKMYLNKGDTFSISWTKNDAQSYEYKLLLNSNGDMISIRNDKTKENFISNDVNLFGQYLFQVRAVRGDTISQWSKPISFTIRKKEKAFDAVPSLPENESTFLLSGQPIEFKWHGSDDAEYIIELSKDRSFEELILQKASFTKSMAYTPQVEGDIYWRVKTTLNQKLNKYRVVHIEYLPPKIIKPFKNSVLSSDDVHELEVEWEANIDSAFIVEVSENPNFSKINTIKKTRSKKVILKLDTGKKFYIRVSKEGSKSYSKTKIFTIKKIKKLITPKIKKNLRFKLKQTYIPKKIGPYTFLFSPFIAANKGQFSSYIDIEWDKMEGAREYEIIIYKDRASKEILEREIVKKPRFRWGTPTVGTFFWKIRYTDKYDRKSDFSNISKLVIEKEMIKKVSKVVGIPYFTQITPKHGFKTIEKATVTLRWANVKNASKYRVLLYTDFDRGIIYKKLITKNKVLRVKFPSGQFYWKIEALNIRGHIIGKTKARLIKSKAVEEVQVIELADNTYREKKKKRKKEPQKNPKKETRNPFLDRKVNPNTKSFVLGGLKPGTYNLSTDLDGSLSTSADNLLMLASFDIYAGLNYSEDLYFEAFYDYKTAGNSDLTIFDHTYGAIAYKYFESTKKRNIMYGLGARHSIFNVELQDTTTDSSVSLNYFNMLGKILFDIPLFVFEQRISMEAGYGFLAPTSYYYQLSYHAKYYYFEKIGLTPLKNVFIFLGGEYMSRNIKYQDSVIKIQNLLGIGGMGIDVKF